MRDQTSLRNERVKYVRSLLLAKYRQRERAFVIEGVRLLEEALRAGAGLSVILVAEDALIRTERGAALLDRLRPFHPLSVSQQTLNAVAGSVTPQGVVAAVPIPPPPAIDRQSPLVVVLENLGDPGNVGTILRTAWASGIAGTVVAVAGVDLYSPKVVRAAAGAHFHLRLLSAERWSEIEPMLYDRRLLAAVAGAGKSYDQVSWQPPVALVIGSEAHGVSAAIMSVAEPVHIPMPGGAESINAAVAAGILLFEAVKHLSVR